MNEGFIRFPRGELLRLARSGHVDRRAALWLAVVAMARWSPGKAANGAEIPVGAAETTYRELAAIVGGTPNSVRKHIERQQPGTPYRVTPITGVTAGVGLVLKAEGYEVFARDSERAHPKAAGVTTGVGRERPGSTAKTARVTPENGRTHPITEKKKEERNSPTLRVPRNRTGTTPRRTPTLANGSNPRVYYQPPEDEPMSADEWRGFLAELHEKADEAPA